MPGVPGIGDAGHGLDCQLLIEIENYQPALPGTRSSGRPQGGNDRVSVRLATGLRRDLCPGSRRLTTYPSTCICGMYCTGYATLLAQI